jgi:hypothetical protein
MELPRRKFLHLTISATALAAGLDVVDAVGHKTPYVKRLASAKAERTLYPTHLAKSLAGGTTASGDATNTET